MSTNFKKWIQDPVPVLVACLPALFPFYLFKGEFLGIPTHALELLLGVLTVAFVFRYEVYKKSFWVSETLNLDLLPLGFFLLAAVLSVMGVHDEHALGIFKGWVLAPMLYFSMARTVFRDKPSLMPVSFGAAFLGAMGLSVYGILPFGTGQGWTVDHRFAGPFVSANYLSLYLGPLFVAALLILVQKTEALPRWFLLSTVLILGLALLLSQSYAAWLAMAVSLAAYTWIHRKALPVRLKWGPVLLAVPLLLVVFSPLGLAKLQQFFDLAGRSSSSVRIEIYQIAADLIARNPVFGVGLGQFEFWYKTVAPIVLGHAPMEWVMLHPHNIFLAFWLNMGLLGLVAFVLLLKKAWSWLFEMGPQLKFVAAFMVLEIVLHGLFDTPYFKPDLAYLFWWVFAFLL